MSQRNSEYERQPGDTYVTPQWVWDALYSVEPWARHAFDCAPADRNGYDFLQDDAHYPEGIASNPPYGRAAERFVRHALSFPSHGNVAMLLPHAWDCAKLRTDLFRDKRFRAKYTLTERIRWANLDQKKNGPSSNHAWYVWQGDYTGRVRPFMGWL